MSAGSKIYLVCVEKSLRSKSSLAVNTQKLKKKKKEEEEKEKELSACRGEGSAVGPLLAARALSLRCTASAMLTICTGYA
jgi:hypothetical protein